MPTATASSTTVPVGTVRTTTADTTATVCQLGSSGITDADGNFAITLPGETTRLVGPALIEATSGQFIDEATGNTETGPIGAANTTLRTLVPVDYLDELRLPSGGGTTIERVAVTALTEIATTRALAVANESLGGPGRADPKQRRADLGAGPCGQCPDRQPLRFGRVGYRPHHSIGYS